MIGSPFISNNSMLNYRVWCKYCKVEFGGGGNHRKDCEYKSRMKLYKANKVTQ